MVKGRWCAAFTIELDGKLMDFTELSSISQTQILLQLRRGITEGELFADEVWRMDGREKLAARNSAVSLPANGHRRAAS